MFHAAEKHTEETNRLRYIQTETKTSGWR